MLKEEIKSFVDNFEAYWVKFEQYLIALLAGCISYIWGKYNFSLTFSDVLIYTTIVFYLCIIVFIISLILTYYFNKDLLTKLAKIEKIPMLEKQIDELQEAVADFKLQQIEHAYSNVNSKFLAYIADKVELDFTQRVSLYLVDKKRNLFHIVGRYSKNGNYDKKHRSTFNINSGTLGNIWRCSSKEKICLPLEEKKYFRECREKFGMRQKDVQKLSMKSREFYAIPIIKDLSSQIGIILFEAEKCHTLDEAKIDSCITDIRPILVQLLSQYEDLSDITEGNQNE